jgi:hypothetical protein
MLLSLLWHGERGAIGQLGLGEGHALFPRDQNEVVGVKFKGTRSTFQLLGLHVDLDD